LSFPSIDRAEAIVALTENRILREYGNVVLDLSTPDREFAAATSHQAREQLPGVGCTGREILNLTYTEYQHWANAVAVGFEDVARLLHGHKMFEAADLPYPMQLVTLAAICTVLKERVAADKVRSQLMHKI
jgi:hypothetical protein